MISYLAFIICLNTAPAYLEACKTSIRAASIQTGFQVYSDALDNYSQNTAKKIVHRLNIPETMIAVGYIAYQWEFKNSLVIPLPYSPISDKVTLWGSRSSLGLTFEWKW